MDWVGAYPRQGVAADLVAAKRWLEQASAGGDHDAMCNLGFMYHQGNGVRHDAREAFRLSQLSAELGNAQCQFNLGVFYRDALGVPRDAVSSYVWFAIAASAELAGAHGKATLMKRELTAEQLAEADKRLAAWLARPKPKPKPID